VIEHVKSFGDRVPLGHKLLDRLHGVIDRHDAVIFIVSMRQPEEMTKFVRYGESGEGCSFIEVNVVAV
jgi:hypothetical protein